jgi:NitT/TauT family transport system substrate-binding protein
MGDFGLKGRYRARMAHRGRLAVARIRIMFSRFSAFYSPLIAAQAAGFLKAEGLDAEFAVAGPDRSPQAGLRDGSLDLIQSAPSASFASLERGETPDLAHFAQINQRDGFFIAGRAPDPAFAWGKLAGARVLVDHGAQPLAMFRYALHRRGVDYGALSVVDAGNPEAMQAAFRAGEGDYIHLQGPAPQQLEADGVAHVVAAVGEAIGPVAFSSLCARREFIDTDMARAFTAAYARARAWVRETAARRVAEAEAGFFEGADPEVLTRTIAAYQHLGCWGGALVIPKDAYEVTLDVFAHSGLITKRHPYDAVVVAPPAA